MADYFSYIMRKEKDWYNLQVKERPSRIEFAIQMLVRNGAPRDHGSRITLINGFLSLNVIKPAITKMKPPL